MRLATIRQHLFLLRRRQQLFVAQSSSLYHTSAPRLQRPLRQPQLLSPSHPQVEHIEPEPEPFSSSSSAVDNEASLRLLLSHQQQQAELQQKRRQQRIQQAVRAKTAAAAAASPASPKSGRPKENAEEKAAARAAMLSQPVDISDVTVVNSLVSAHRALSVLLSPALRHRYHAIDTEVADIEVKEQSPVGHGRVTAITVYCGPDADFGSGPRLFIDCLDSEDGSELLPVFASYLSSPDIRKVFHHYSFDYHVLLNAGVRVGGFAGDTMHMARLWDASRSSYSLEALSGDMLGRGKVNMRERFSIGKRKKDGSEGKQLVLPPIAEIQRGRDRAAWIDYATYDAQSTHCLREILEAELRNQPNPLLVSTPTGGNQFSFYLNYYVPFAQALVDMERQGVYVRARDLLPQLQHRAEQDQAKAVAAFLQWAARYDPNARFMNVRSNEQKRHFFFGQRGEKAEFERENTEGWIDGAAEQRDEDDEGAGSRDSGCDGADGQEAEERQTARAEEAGDDAESAGQQGKAAKAKGKAKEKKPKKLRPFTLTGLGLQPIGLTKGKDAAVSVDVLRQLSGRLDCSPPQYGSAHDFFSHFTPDSTPADGEAACAAIGHLCTLSALSTTLNTFILPLQSQSDASSRIHCSLNLNTETGRLSSRRPNLQNQPALEKDLYRIREAFAAPPGRRLIVADYGQLELRVLAHMTRCRSMIDAFAAGGDFHSRTAMGMYAYVRQAVDSGEVVLEGGGQAGGRPSLKARFAAERRKAKTLNFSIAYGKTARGLAADWGTSVEEAERTLAAWYSDRPEVRQWQQRTVEEAHRSGYSRTLMGRYRLLRGINGSDRGLRGHMERAAINTPIQGGAADIVMQAMLRLHSQHRLRHLGWAMVLQIHDEIIAEGPQESAEEAVGIIADCMQHPFSRPLLVDLVVDAKCADTWYGAK